MIRRFCNHIPMVMVYFRPSSVLTSAGEETCTQRRVDMISLQALGLQSSGEGGPASLLLAASISVKLVNSPFGKALDTASDPVWFATFDGTMLS